MSRRAFTQIELLVVITVIAILAVMGVPAVSQIRERANESKCLSNLRQIGVGLVAYAADHNQDLPTQYWWGNGAAPVSLTCASGPNALGFLASEGYLGPVVDQPVGSKRPKVLRCPSRPSGDFFNYAEDWCSYVYQNPFPKGDGQPDPSKTNKAMVLRSSWAMVIDASQVFAGHPAPHGTKGNDKTNVLYGDMHAESRPFIDNTSAPFGVWPSAFDLTKENRE